MRRLFFALVAILCVVGVAYSQSIIIAPKEGGPFRQVLTVHNDVSNSSTLDVGDVVVWDIAASTGDDDPWVATTTTADTFLVAGVVVVGAAPGNDAIIATYGTVDVDVISSGAGYLITAGSPLCTSGTAGSARECQVDTDAAEELVNRHFGFAVGTASGGSVKAVINP